jgi:hypothetical protein
MHFNNGLKVSDLQLQKERETEKSEKKETRILLQTNQYYSPFT